MTTDIAINHELDERLDDIRQSNGGTVAVDDIKEVVESIMGSMQGELTATDIQLYLELESLAAFIDSAKLDIAALRPDEVTDDYIPPATDELDAIVNATAEATNRIMDYAEIIEGVVDEVSPEVADKLMESTTNIFEACGFQDITGQRITKVVNALKDIDDKVNRLVEAFGTEIDRYKSALPETESVEDKAPTDEELLSGPQLENKAQSQEDIDALLASFD